VSIKEAIGGLPSLEAGEKDSQDNLHVCSKLSKINLVRIQHSKPGGTWRDWPEELLPDCYKKKSGQTYSSVYGRMCWDNLSPTITTQFYKYGTGRFGHPDQNRAISLREGALIQSFPNDYLFIEKQNEINFTRIGRHIGNAVPPKLGKYIGECILKHLESCGVNYV